MTVGCSRSGRRRACLLWQMPSDSVTLNDERDPGERASTRLIGNRVRGSHQWRPCIWARKAAAGQVLVVPRRR